MYVFADQHFVPPDQSANMGQIDSNIHRTMPAQRKNPLCISEQRLRAWALGLVSGPNLKLRVFFGKVFYDYERFPYD
jgi:hypothetical protein